MKASLAITVDQAQGVNRAVGMGRVVESRQDFKILLWYTNNFVTISNHLVRDHNFGKSLCSLDVSYLQSSGKIASKMQRVFF